MQRTLVLAKPDAVQRGLIGEILGRFERKGLKVVGLRLLAVPREMAEEHYAVHAGKHFYDGLVEFITSGPVAAIASNVGNATSPAAVRTRGRWIATFRPPRTTSLRVVPARLAGRSGSWAYRGPQMAVRSSSSMVVKTFRPDRSANSNSSVFMSTSRSTSGR